MRARSIACQVLLVVLLAARPGRADDYQPEQRPASLVATAADSLTLSNVRWGFGKGGRPRFEDTTIRPDQVKDVYLILEPFQPEWLAAHGALGFELDKGGVVGADGKRSAGLVLSVEARLKKGQSYSLVEGFKDRFGIVYQVGTMTDFYQKTVARQGNRVIRYRLKLTAAQKQALLRNALAEAVQDRSGEHYHTTRNSCYQNVHRILNTVLPRDQRVRDWLVRVPLPGGKSFGIYNPLATWPKAATFAYRRVIEPGSRVEAHARPK
jgi:hypothetical protein